MNTTSGGIAPADALWALIQSQPARVRNDLRKRFEAATTPESKQEAKRKKQEAYIRTTFFQAMSEAEEMIRTGKHGLSKEQFLEELKNA